MGLSSSAISKGVTVDTTAPTPGLVLVGTIQSHKLHHTCNRIEVHWRDFNDDESSTLDYQVAVGSHPSIQDALSFQTVNSGFAVLSNVSMQEGHGYYVQIKVGVHRVSL